MLVAILYRNRIKERTFCQKNKIQLTPSAQYVPVADDVTVFVHWRYVDLRVELHLRCPVRVIRSTLDRERVDPVLERRGRGTLKHRHRQAHIRESSSSSSMLN